MEQVGSNNFKKKNTNIHLLNSSNFAVKFVLVAIFSCTIFFILGDTTFSSTIIQLMHIFLAERPLP
jgi:hypothetical protein